MITVGSSCPTFDLPLVGGGRVRSQDLTKVGRPALVVLFKTECPTCRLAFPFLQRIWDRVRRLPEAAGFLAIAQNPPGEIPAFFAQYGATFPCATDVEPYPASNAFEITNVPSLFLLDEHGVIVRASVGFSRKEYDEIADELLAHAGAPRLGSLFSDVDAGVPVLQPG
jgi:peroxiredoxin